MHKARARLNPLSSDRAFTTVELVVVILVIGLIMAFIYPQMAALVLDAHLAEVRQDALAIGAAIEAIKLSGVFDPGDMRLSDMICEIAGKRFDGHIDELGADGSFIYSRTVSGVEYSVLYDSRSSSVEDVM